MLRSKSTICKLVRSQNKIIVLKGQLKENCFCQLLILFNYQRMYQVEHSYIQIYTKYFSIYHASHFKHCVILVAFLTCVNFFLIPVDNKFSHITAYNCINSLINHMQQEFIVGFCFLDLWATPRHTRTSFALRNHMWYAWGTIWYSKDKHGLVTYKSSIDQLCYIFSHWSLSLLNNFHRKQIFEQ